jgi:hypothetical protein
MVAHVILIHRLGSDVIPERSRDGSGLVETVYRCESRELVIVIDSRRCDRLGDTAVIVIIAVVGVSWQRAVVVLVWQRGIQRVAFVGRWYTSEMLERSFLLQVLSSQGRE